MDGNADIRVSLMIVHLLPTTFYPWSESAREKNAEPKAARSICPRRREDPAVIAAIRKITAARRDACSQMASKLKQLDSAALSPLALGRTAPHALALNRGRPSDQQ
jgi:hypothetical protein